MNTAYDVIVVGGGHAGCEAALASARSGASTLLLTLKHAAIARMPCNPSIGGIAKAHLVFELDALGGEMARNTDHTGIQFRVLNTKRGPAVQSNRAQCDKKAYSLRMQSVIAMTSGLSVREARVTGLWIEGGRLRGVCADAVEMISGKAVILTPGTATSGVIHIGDRSYSGGGNGEDAVHEMSRSLRDCGFVLGRLKTGTPPRLRKDSIDRTVMQAQAGDEPPPLFSWAGRRAFRMFHVEQRAPSPSDTGAMFHVEQHGRALSPWYRGSHQMPCYLTHTTAQTHDIIRRNLSRSSLYGGFIEGVGVRYCPSVEDKIVKFPDKDRHHVFIEPEGRDTNLIYPNGISNSLPVDVQNELVHSIPGLEHAEIVEPAFAIEYDFANPTQLQPSLETKLVENLYFAGQINGTTGYEEAAAQGFIAGVNAARKTQAKAPIVLERSRAYIGVLIDDLVTKGTNEPYRMFTSRAEHRLILRQDNARYRLHGVAQELGIADKHYLAETQRFAAEIASELDRLSKEHYHGASLLQILRRHDTRYTDLPSKRDSLDAEVITQLEIAAKYEGYIRHEEQQVAKLLNAENVKIPDSIDYWSIKTIRRETREKLSQIRPKNLGQASRIPGVSPADIAMLSVIIRAK